MFFKKKKEELSDQLATYQVRGAPRWGTPQYDLDAGISITGFEGEGQIGNVSISGCCMKSVTYVAITPNETYQAKIIPGKEDKMEPFSLKLKLVWTKSSETVFLAGFALEGISASGGSIASIGSDASDGYEGSSKLRSYVELLRSRGLKPDYGKMNSNHH